MVFIFSMVLSRLAEELVVEAVSLSCSLMELSYYWLFLWFYGGSWNLP